MHDGQTHSEKTDRELLYLILEGIELMSQSADQITAAAAAITAAVATLTQNGLPDPTLQPAIDALNTAVTALTALAATSASAPVVASLTVSPSTLALSVGATPGVLTVAAVDANGKAIVSPVLAFLSSAPSVATVDAVGTVTAVATGSATITVTSGNAPTISAAVTVS